MFPSPHGDKLQRQQMQTAYANKRFPSPLGINFNIRRRAKFLRDCVSVPSQGLISTSTTSAVTPISFGFRPLTGINFNTIYNANLYKALVFPSPHGDKFQRLMMRKRRRQGNFCPLTGINFNEVQRRY